MRLRCNIMLLKLLTFTILVGACHLSDNSVSADALGLAGFEADQTVLAKKSNICDGMASALTDITRIVPHFSLPWN